MKKYLPYRIIRSNAGVFAGYVTSIEKDVVTLVDARRLWYWKGAASLSQLAIDGVSCPDECKFSVPVDETVLGVIEIIDVTEKAQQSIAWVKEWNGDGSDYGYG